MVRKAGTGRELRQARHLRVRKKIFGATERPRLCIFRSLNHIYAQVIDDKTGRTLVAASTLEAELKAKKDGLAKADVAKLVGTLVAKRAKEKGVESVVFDRGGYRYHGRVKALADAAREGGLVF